MAEMSEPNCGVKIVLAQCSEALWNQYKRNSLFSAWFASKAKIVEFVLFGVLAWLLCPTGIGWNVFTAYRISRLRRSRLPCQKYLLSQTAWNSLMLGTSFALLCVPQLFFRNLYRSSYLAARVHVGEIFLLNVFVLGSAGLSALVAMERILDVVTKNVISHVMINKRFVAAHWILIAGVLCWTIPRLDDFEVVTCCAENSDQSATVIALVQAPSSGANWSIDSPLYHMMGRSTGLLLTPVVCCIPFLFYITVSLLRSGPVYSGPPTAGEIRMRNIAFTEFTLFALKFLTFFTPSFVLGGVALVVAEERLLRSDCFHMLQHVSHFLVMCHSATFGLTLRCFQCRCHCWKSPPVYQLVPLRPTPFDHPSEHTFVQFIVMKYRTQRGSLPMSRHSRRALSNEPTSGRRFSRFERGKRVALIDRYKITL